MVESLSLETVWTDEFEMKYKDQFVASMQISIQASRCVLILFSLSYFASQNCLWELAWALMVHINEGGSVIFIAVDKNVTFETTGISKSKQWKAGKGISVTDSKGEKITGKHEDYCSLRCSQVADKDQNL